MKKVLYKVVSLPDSLWETDNRNEVMDTLRRVNIIEDDMQELRFREVVQGGTQIENYLEAIFSVSGFELVSVLNEWDTTARVPRYCKYYFKKVIEL